ncbi:branched-chain amino acid ABC transporter permease [Nocardia jiangxiensis]|uniref:Branched-chain amino acid ABC transporter permease n=1 Tax=Nocardia jiangxiensis TaxID=282685 RepID=A0ABW6SBV0_9NOCA|nr:branched-chain amino acid ABC transporter permease [Nocardia jiangxiensis]
MNATIVAKKEPKTLRGNRIGGVLVRNRIPRGALVAVVVLAAGLAVPYIVLDRYYITLLFDGLILSMLALSIGFLARHLGLISLGHVAFFGGAAYGYAIAITRWQFTPLAAAGFGLLVGTVLAIVMGALVVRATGMGFLMLTLAFGQALYALCIQRFAIPYTGAFDGLQAPFPPGTSFLGLSRSDVMNAGLFWPVAWIVLVLVVFGMWVVGRTSFGTLLEGIRENEERMRFSGFDTYRPRLIAFVASGFVAALAGVLFAINAAYVSPEVLGFLEAGDSLTATIVGGASTLGGPVLGGFLYVWAQATFNSSGNLHLYIGIALILVLMFLPGGIVGSAQRLWGRMRSRRKENEK